MDRKGQLSYEYILVIGMVLTLIIPFFYSFSIGLTGGIGKATTEGAIQRMAQATQTIAHLGGEGSTMRLPARLSRIEEGSEDIRFNRIAFTAGQRYSVQSGVPRLVAGQNVFEGGGMQQVKIQMGQLDTIIIGNAPAIIAACPKDILVPTHKGCSATNLQIDPPDGFLLVGGNFPSDAKLYGVKKSNTVPIFTGEQICGSAGQECVESSDCNVGEYCSPTCMCEVTACDTPSAECTGNPNVKECGAGTCMIDECLCTNVEPQVEEIIDDRMLKIATDKTGKGTYQFVVEDSLGRQSKAITVIVEPSGGGPPEEPVE